jgi:hypothetical protein
MKSKKVFKRIAKIEALIKEVTERSSQSAPHVRELLRDAKAAVARAKKALSLEASSGTAKKPPAKGAKPPAKATPEPSRPKRKFSAAGRRAISEATKKRWAAKRAAAKAEPAIAKKATVKKAVAKKVAPVRAFPVSTAKPSAPRVTKKAPVKKSAPAQAAKAPTRKVAKKAPVTKAAVKAPAKKAVRIVRVATTPAPGTTEPTTVTTPEPVAPEAPVQ